MPKSESEIYLLQAAIRQMHGCESAHVKTVFVDERFQGNTIWKGDIEVFELLGHPKATQCFAWMHREEGKGSRPIVLLDKWPVNSPQTAIGFAIAFDVATHQMPEVV